MTMWGIHNDALGAELVEEGFVSIGWDRVGDLRRIPNDQAAFRKALLPLYPEAKAGALPVWAGILRRFAYEMQPGDIVVAPYKANRTINIGVIDGPYEHHPELAVHKSRRRVQWRKTGAARALFPAAALSEIGSAMTLFQIKRNEAVFRAYLDAASDDAFLAFPAEPVEPPIEPEPDTVALTTASDIEQATQDVVVKTLLTDLTHEEFEHFTADLLRVIGYQARVTQFSADGGIDVIAHRDPLGLEPPIIKVQCKHTSATQGAPPVQQLLGTLSQEELGLFVTLGSFSKDAFALERGRRDLRLLGGADITRLVLEHYAHLPSRWRDRMPLRQVWAVDSEADGPRG